MNAQDLKEIEKCYDKQGNLTELGKAVMNHKPKNIIIRPVRNMYNPSTGKVETHTMTQEEMIRLNRYLNKYFRKHWQMYHEGGYGDEVTQ